MDCSLSDFYICSINRIHFIDEKIYKTNHVKYKTDLLWDELIFFKDTVATIYFDNFVFHIEPNDILYLPKGAHDRYSIDFVESGSFIDIFYISNISLNSTPRIYKSVSSNALYNDFQRILGKWQQDNVYNLPKCMSLLWDIIFELQRNNYVPQNRYQLIEPAVNYINANLFSTKISVEELASQCGISYSYFLRIFQKRFSTTPKNYIIKMKIDYSCELLREEKSVSEIAEQLGFSDVYFFSRQFKKHMDMSPTEYRKKLQQNNRWFNYVKDFEEI